MLKNPLFKPLVAVSLLLVLLAYPAFQTLRLDVIKWAMDQPEMDGLVQDAQLKQLNDNIPDVPAVKVKK